MEGGRGRGREERGEREGERREERFIAVNNYYVLLTVCGH